jgi:NAD+--asparagine ADP-ribosyltransferase
VFASSERTYAFRRINNWRRPYVSRIPVENFDTSEKVTQNNRYKMCKMQWSNHTKDKATWEKEYQLKAEYPDIFSDLSESRGRD